MPKYKVRVQVESYYHLDIEADDEDAAVETAIVRCIEDGYIAFSSEVQAEVVDDTPVDATD